MFERGYSNRYSKYTWKKTLAILDFFPQPIPSFHIRGRTKVTSLLGSICGSIFLLILLFYAANMFTHLVSKSNPSISVYTDRGAITSYDSLNVRDAGMRFAFGVEGWLDRELKDDQRYVKMLVRQFGRLDGKKYERILPHRKCRPEDYEEFAPPA